MQHSVITCSRRIEFDAAHRVMEHESKCKHLHGHRYVVEANFEARHLDTLGRVIDFGEIKELLGGWIDEHWDHTAILWEKDKALGDAIAAETGQNIYYLPWNPTAENLARYLLESVIPKLFCGKHVQCRRVVVGETPNCKAIAKTPV